MEDKAIPSLIDLDSLELSEDHNEINLSDRSRCAAYLVLNNHPERIVRGEIQMRSIDKKLPSSLIYALGVGSVDPWGERIGMGLFFVRYLNKNESPHYISLRALKSFTSLSPTEKFE